MSLTLLPLLAVMLLADPNELIDTEAAAAIPSNTCVRLLQAGPKVEKRKNARITSRMCDFDRKEGVVLFEGDVVVSYDDDYVMCADTVYVLLSGSNELGRVVAVGNVSITNETRIGTCELATYRRRRGEIEMFGETGKSSARLVDTGKGGGELEGSCIRFWLDSEQVEVVNSRISMKEAGMKGGL